MKKQRLWALSRPERKFLIVAFLACSFSGCVFPVFSLILSTVISFFYLDDPDSLQSKVRCLRQPAMRVNLQLCLVLAGPNTSCRGGNATVLSLLECGATSTCSLVMWYFRDA